MRRRPSRGSYSLNKCYKGFLMRWPEKILMEEEEKKKITQE
jgi:hypothetical protein